jgi:peroxiredoxin
LRDDYPLFRDRGAEVLGIAPHNLEDVEALVESMALPFPVAADPERAVFAIYDVQNRILSLGQRPGLYVVDRQGVVRFAHLGWQQWDLPANAEVLDVLDRLEAGSAGFGPEGDSP